MDPRYFTRIAYAVFVAMYSVLAVAGLMAMLGTVVDKQPVLAIAFTVVTAVLIHFVWLVYDRFKATF
ncbi:MAG TPA: hypothetical protein VFO84_03485 [Dehalococcoidia bacterium]|nr:hypothetical protein [Dehalococcoidia bacterium]